MMKVLIVEDEKMAAERLSGLLHSIDPGIEIAAVIDTVRDSVVWLKEHKADLIFLDIHLSDGLSFEIFSKLDLKTPVVFTTAYDEYALKAFKVNSIDYLLKPFTESDVRNAIAKYQSFFHGSQDIPDFESLVRMLNPAKQFQKRFLVNAGALIKSIPIEEIAFFYNIEKSTFICTESNHSYASAQSLDKLEMLVDPEQFFRINRNFLVGFRSIKKIYTLSKSRMKLELQPHTEQEILVSFNKSGEFRQWLGKIPEV